MSTEHTLCITKNWRWRSTPPLSGRWMSCLIPVTAVWQLRSGSYPYWEEKKATNAGASLLQSTPPPPMTAETREGTCNILGSDWLQRTALGFHGLRTPYPTTFPQKAGALRQMWPGHREDVQFPMEYRTFSIILHRSQKPSSTRKTCVSAPLTGKQNKDLFLSCC